MKLKSFALLILILCGNLTTLQALTLAQCQEEAQRNYPLINKYGLIEKSREYSISNANKGYLPNISFNAQATWQNSVAGYPDELASKFAQMGVTMGSLNKDQYKVAVELYQTIWDGGEIKSQQTTIDAQNRVNTLATDVEMYAIKERVNNLYFGILLIERQIAQNKDLIGTLTSNCEKISNLINNGTATESDLAIIEAERLSAIQNSVALKANNENYRKMLSIFTGSIIGDESLELPGIADYNNPANQRPELKLFKAQKELAQSEMKAINASLMPRIGAFAQGYYGNPGFNLFKDMQENKWSFNFLVGLKVQWNIGSLYRKSNNVKAIQLKQDEVDINNNLFEFNNNLQVTGKRNDIEKIKSIMAEDNKIIELRNKVRLSTESKLINGVADVNDLLQDITKENQARIQKEYHEIELLKNIYDLNTLTNN